MVIRDPVNAVRYSGYARGRAAGMPATVARPALRRYDSFRGAGRPMTRTFTFVPARDRPVWSTAPLTTRMVSPYRDRTGRVHIFADSFDPSEPGRFQDRLSSWAAVQRYYSTADFERFDDHGVVVGRGRWTGDPATSDADCVGAGSPGVTVAGDGVLLFYAGRGPADPAGPFEHSMNRADLPGQIMLAIAPADADGAPAGPFVKQGAVGTAAPGRRRAPTWPST